VLRKRPATRTGVTSVAHDPTRLGEGPFLPGTRVTMSRGASRAARVAAAGALLAVVAFAVGPRVRLESRWVEPSLPPDLDAYLAHAEEAVDDLRPGDQKGIVWLDPVAPAVTPLSIVYLHGFSADRHEVEPLVSDVARAIGANVYFTRFRGHGRDEAAMGEATAEGWMDDTAEAIAVGGRIGDRVVVMATSTGGTLALWAASREEAQRRIAALVLVSPNLGVMDPAAPLLLWPWGGQIARLVVGPERCFEAQSAEEERHWTTCYPTRALLPMMGMVDLVRSLPPGSVTVPTLVMYATGDQIVDPDETERVVTRLTGGGASMEVIEGADDPAQHVIAGEIMSPAATEVVRRTILDFLGALPN